MSTLSRRPCRHHLPHATWTRLLTQRSSLKGHTDAGRRPTPQRQRTPDADLAVNCVAAAPVPPWKRASDLLLILLALPLIMILVPMLYVWIKLVSPGHFIFKQTRIGRGGKPFTLYKIRTMKPRAAEHVHQSHVIHLVKSNLPLSKLDFGHDSRLIPGAWLLRMSGLDELPQLVNVLRGEMSLVGPRPCLPAEFPLYNLDHYQRFSTQPGLTGLWQVERTGTTTFSQMVKMDVRYVHRMSPWLDTKILLKTPAALLGQVMTCARIRAGEAAARRVFSRIFAR